MCFITYSLRVMVDLEGGSDVDAFVYRAGWWLHSFHFGLPYSMFLKGLHNVTTIGSLIQPIRGLRENCHVSQPKNTIAGPYSRFSASQTRENLPFSYGACGAI